MRKMTRNVKGQYEKGGKTRKYYPKLGDTYGDYIVISEDVEFTNDNKIKYHVRCSCGYEHFVRAYFLFTGRQLSCRECSSRKAYNRALIEGKKIGFIKLHHEGVGNLTKTAYWYFKNNAARRKIEWSEDLTIEYLWKLFQDQNNKCALSGLDIKLTEKRKLSNIDFEYMTASLDRIDSSKPYTTDNVQWVHKDINRMKWCFKENRFIELCKLIVNHANQQPS